MKGARLLEQGGGDVWIGISVHGEHALFFLLIGEDQLLSGVDPVAPLQAGVVAQQLPQRDPGVPGDGKQRVTGPDGIGGTGILDHQRLPHYQLGRIWKLIVLDEPGHGDAVLIGQFIQGVSRPNHMDIHKKLLSSGFQINVMKSCLA